MEGPHEPAARATANPMPTSSLASDLVNASLLSQEIAAQAERRRLLYGGGLDTVLLEMGLLDEKTLVTHNPDGDNITVLESSNEETEATGMVTEIQRK